MSRVVCVCIDGALDAMDCCFKAIGRENRELDGAQHVLRFAPVDQIQDEKFSNFEQVVGDANSADSVWALVGRGRL